MTREYVATAQNQAAVFWRLNRQLERTKSLRTKVAILEELRILLMTWDSICPTLRSRMTEVIARHTDMPVAV